MATSSSSSSLSSSNTKIGPRAKCDQIVYESISKATEIIVHGRCHVDNNKNSSNNSGVSRFHLEVDEVDLVR